MLRFKNKSWAIRNILKLQPTTEWQLHETDPEQWKILSHKLESLETSRPCCFYAGGGSLRTHLSKHMDLDKWKLQGGSASVLQLKTLKIKSLQIFLLPSLTWQSTTRAVALSVQLTRALFPEVKMERIFSLKLFLFLQLVTAHFYWKKRDKSSFYSLSCILKLPCAGHLQKLAKLACLLSAIYLTF